MLLHTQRLLRLPPDTDNPEGRTVTQPFHVRTDLVQAWSPSLIGQAENDPFTDLILSGQMITITLPYKEFSALMEREHGSRLLNLQTKISTH